MGLQSPGSRQTWSGRLWRKKGMEQMRKGPFRLSLTWKLKWGSPRPLLGGTIWVCPPHWGNGGLTPWGAPPELCHPFLVWLEANSALLITVIDITYLDVKLQCFQMSNAIIAKESACIYLSCNEWAYILMLYANPCIVTMPSDWSRPAIYAAQKEFRVFHWVHLSSRAQVFKLKFLTEHTTY